MEARVTAFFRMPRKRTEDALEYSCLGRDLTTLFAGNFCRLDPFSLFIASFPPLFRALDSYCYVHLKHSTWKSDGQQSLFMAFTLGQILPSVMSSQDKQGRQTPVGSSSKLRGPPPPLLVSLWEMDSPVTTHQVGQILKKRYHWDSEV